MAAAVVSISDELLSQQLDLLRFEASQRQDVLAQLAQLQAELISRLAAADVTSFTKARLQSLLAQADQAISSYYGALGDQLDASLTSMAELTAAHAANAMETYFLGGVDVALPTDTFMSRLTGNALVQGAASADWWAKQGQDVSFRFATAVRQGAAAGDALGGIVARVRDVMDIGRSNARSLVHTSIMEVSAEARKEVYQQNSDVVEGTMQLSTLDSHTTDICMAYSGAEYDLEGNPIGDTQLPYDGGVPRHWGCRSIEVPITKTFAELGIDAPEPPPGERASADGPVPADITFDEFLGRMGKDFQDETLGAGRAELWRKGDITLPQLLDLQGNPLTLAELEAKYGSATVKEVISEEYAKAGAEVAGLTVRAHIPNEDSIQASLTDYKSLGVREVPISAFDQDYVSSIQAGRLDARTASLLDQIKESGEINPLIVVLDEKGPYVLEGAHRFDALIAGGYTSFPAKVIVDLESAGVDPTKWNWIYKGD